MEYFDDTKTRVLVPAGEYILGDPCYTVPDELWMPLLKSNNYFGEPIGEVEKDGVVHQVLGFHTAYGDGEYFDQYSNRYPVDAGVIGLVPAALAENARDDLGRRVLFAQTVIADAADGTLFFGSYVIETNDLVSDDADFEYEDETDD